MDNQARLLNALLAIKKLQSDIEALEKPRREPIAIIGVGCRFPGGVGDPEAFWRLLSDGVDVVAEVPQDRWDVDGWYDPDPEAVGKIATRCGAFLERIDTFDPRFFGISPREATALDPQQRLLLEVSWEALERAGIAPDGLGGSKTGIFIGVGLDDYAALHLRSGDVASLDVYSGTGAGLCFTAGRLSFLLGLQGPSLAVDTACSSSLVAVHLACQSLRLGESSLALAGGVNVILSPEVNVYLSRARALSPDGRCKTFDAAANGYVRGEGCGVLVLKRLSDARADGDDILAVIRGSAVNHDGASSGLTVPHGPAQQAIIRQALAQAGVEPAAVGYVEAHGTGTSLGDPIEVEALGAVLGEGRPKDRPLVIGAVKTNIGHLETAAGIAGLIKAALVLCHGEIPPHLHFKEPSPLIAWSELPVTVATERTPFPGPGPRIAGVSSFGLSGTNAHVVLEEAPARAARDAANRARPLHLLVLSARDPQALGELSTRYRGHLEGASAEQLGDMCFTAAGGRAQFSHRAAVVAGSVEEMRDRLGALSAGQPGVGVALGQPERGKRPRVAFLFTGQGAQFAGMGRELYASEPVFRAVLNECEQLLMPYLPKPLRAVMDGTSGAEPSPLGQTRYAQPTLFALEVALARQWQAWGVEPYAVLGHSVGEFAAACIAGVFSLEQGIKLVAERGRLMQALPPGGAMAALFASEERVVEALGSWAGRVEVAAVNGPTEVVVTGASEAVEALVERLQSEGIKARRLETAHAFHSAQMEPMLKELEQLAAAVTYAEPRLKLISNLTGAVAEAGLVTTAGYWRRQARQPVRFAAGMQALSELGVDLFVEVGPKATLLGLGKQSGASSTAAWLPSLREGRSEVQQMLSSLGELWVRGAAIDWAGFHAGQSRRHVALPTYPFQRQRYWVDQVHRRNPGFPSASPASALLSSPLLGRRLRSPAVPDQFFESEISAAALPFLNDHRIYGAVIVPGASHIAMMLCAAAEILGPGACQIEDVTFPQAVRLEEGEVKGLQLVWSPEAPDRFTCRIFSREAEKEAEEPTWRLHATGLVHKSPGSAPPREVVDRSGGGWEEIAREDFYRSTRERGIDLGATFQWVDQIRRRDGEAWCALTRPEALRDAARYPLHPTFIDACVQIFAAAWPAERFEGTAYVPIGLEGFRFDGSSGAPLRARAVLRPDTTPSKDKLVGDVVVLDAEGRVVVELSGLCARRAPREALTRVDQEPAGLFGVDWRRMERPLAAPDREPGRAWVILADRAGIGARLAALLERHGPSVLLQRAGMELTDPRLFDRLFADAPELAGTPLRGVVNLWALDATSTDELTAKSLKAAQGGVCGDTLHLAQALSRIEREGRTRLWLVTRGAQPVIPGRLSVAQAPLWGLGGVIASEHPEWQTTLIDLDPEVDVETSAKALFELLWAADGEDRIALRGADRYASRLAVRAAEGPRGAETSPVQLQIKAEARGSLDNAKPEPVERRPPGRGEVELRVRATGLNFRDVLNVLGMYPGDAGPLGLECSGEVVAVGDGVERMGIHPGDAVIALSPGSFSTFTTVQAELVARKPARMSFEEAATLPIAFLTADFALHRLAGMARGDRVLIHAAAGGVGLAAVQLALRAGAEIFATAGSPEKRRFLASLGVHHTMDSRSLDFAAGVMERTSGRGVDIVLNSLTGEFIPRSLSVLAQGGRFIELGKTGIWSEEQVARLRSDVSYAVFALDDATARNPAEVAKVFSALMQAAEDGALDPLPLQAFSFDHAASAFRYMAQARHIGKVVLTQAPARGAEEPVVRTEATYLLTGGLGSLGLSVARWMVEQGARSLALVGRRAAVGAAAEVVRALEARGAQVKVILGDVACPEDVARILGEIREALPPLRGVLHLAGVLDDGVLEQQRWERFEKVLAPKVSGSWNLHTATLDLPLDFFVLFSSGASLLGSPGQASYSAANAFLDALAHHRRAEGRPAMSVNWGPWAEGGMAEGVDRKRWKSRGLGLIPPEEGLRVLGALVRQGPTQIGVLPIRWEVFAAGAVPPMLSEVVQQVRKMAGKRAEGPETPALLHALRQAAPSRRRGHVLAHLRDNVAKVLGLIGPLDPRQPLRELGLDSLMAVELRNMIGKALGKPLSVTLLFDYPTLDALADHILESFAAVPPGATQSAEREQAPGEASAATLDGLSTGEVEDLLLQELARLNY